MRSLNILYTASHRETAHLEYWEMSVTGTINKTYHVHTYSDTQNMRILTQGFFVRTVVCHHVQCVPWETRHVLRRLQGKTAGRHYDSDLMP